VLALAGCSGWWGDDTATPRGPGEVMAQVSEPGTPGTLLDQRSFPDPPDDWRAWQVAYSSSDALGEAMTATGQVIVPNGPAPAAGWPVVSFGHPTTGTADRCAPSVQGPGAVHLVEELTAAGVALVVADYEGLGSDGAHPYLVGPSAGHTVLDAVRAARALEGGGISAESPVVLAGFSQGGHAALWAAELAASYAPDVDVRGVQAAAPVSDVARFAERAMSYDEQFGVLVTIVMGHAAAYPELDLNDVLAPAALDRLAVTEQACIGEVVEAFTMPVSEGLAADPLDRADWSARLHENRAGTRPLGVPVHVLQGADDPIVYATVTDELVARLCGHGDTVHYERMDGVDHGALLPDRAVAWILARFGGEDPRDDCP
jgi:pimeloyl-ACP methyl ester carboxylesterase